MPSWVLVLVAVKERVIEAARKAIYSPLLETTIDGAEDVIVNGNRWFGYDIDRS